MKLITVESKDFQRILFNLSLEDHYLQPAFQKKVVDIVNANIKITPQIIKDALNHGEV